MKVSQLTPKAQADLIMQKVLAGHALAETLNKSFEQRYMVRGKTLTQWRDHFHIRIPLDAMSPQLAIEVNLQLANLYQEASFYFIEAQKKKENFEVSKNSSYADVKKQIVDEYRENSWKLPAAATLDSMAEYEVQNYSQAAAIYKSEYSFWKQILEQISKVQKMIEQAAISCAVEMNHSKSLDRMQHGNGERK